MAILNDERVINTLDSLKQRWADEYKYEDFSEYESVMRKLIVSPNVEFVKGTKRPFGFQAQVFGITISFGVKYSGNTMSITAKRV